MVNIERGTALADAVQGSLWTEHRTDASTVFQLLSFISAKMIKPAEIERKKERKKERKIVYFLNNSDTQEIFFYVQCNNSRL